MWSALVRSVIVGRTRRTPSSAAFSSRQWPREWRRRNSVKRACPSRITAVGSLDECRAASPDAEVIDTGVAALLPGFIEPHSHPVMSGVATQPPARSIAPWDAPTWADAEAIIADAIATTDPATPLLFAGFDALLHGRPSPKVDELDRMFGDRVAVITDNSGHGAYFNTAVMKRHGWDVNPPADPVGGHYGRNPDGSLNGQGFETAAIMEVAAPLLTQIGGNPLVSAAEYYATMARGGYTSTSDMTYDRKIKPAYEALAAGIPFIVTAGCEAEPLVRKYDVGRLFEAGNSEQLADAIVELASSAEKWAMIRQNAIQLSKRFDRDSIAARTEKLLEAVVQGKPLPAVEW